MNEFLNENKGRNFQDVTYKNNKTRILRKVIFSYRSSICFVNRIRNHYSIRIKFYYIPETIKSLKPHLGIRGLDIKILLFNAVGRNSTVSHPWV